MAHWRDNALLHCMQLLGADGVAVGQYHRIGKGPHCAAQAYDGLAHAWVNMTCTDEVDAKAKILEVTGCQVQQEEDMVTRKRSNSYQDDGDTLSNDPSAEGVTVEEMEAGDGEITAAVEITGDGPLADMLRENKDRIEQELNKPKRRGRGKKQQPDNGAGCIKVEHTQKRLRCPLTDAEVLERADRAAHLVEDAEAREQEFDAAKKQAKAEIDRINAEHRALSAQVRDRAEYRVIDCEVRLDFKTNMVTTLRLDSGEVESERAMTIIERQQAQEELQFKAEQESVAAGRQADGTV
jgi:hypothetical protein